MEAKWQFFAIFNKCYKDSDGKMHVKAIASDDLEDRHGDRISEKAILSMTRQANRKSIDLLSSHHDAFAIGKIHEAKAIHKKTRVQFGVDAILDEDFPQSLKLFKSINAGKRDFQLSIGGFINLDNDKAVTLEENKKGRLVRVINDLILDHIAITRKGMAANPRTGFRSAIVKSIEGVDVNKSVVSFKKFPLADVESSWSFSAADGNKLVDRGGIDLFKSVHTFFDSEKADIKAGFKLPHHKIVDGTIKTFFRGVVAASAVFGGARGGLNVPAKDRPGIASHLRRHFREFDKEPPESIKSVMGTENEEFVFNKQEFIEFFEDQDVEMNWLEGWLKKGDESFIKEDEMKKEDVKKNNKEDDKKEDDETKNVEKKDENKDEVELTNTQKLASIASDIINELREIHKSEDEEVKIPQETITELKSIRDEIQEFLKEIGAEKVEDKKSDDDKDEDDDDEENKSEEDDVSSRLDSLQKSMEEGQVKLAVAVKSAIDEIGKSVKKIAKTRQQSGRIHDDSDNDDVVKKDNVWEGLIVPQD